MSPDAHLFLTALRCATALLFWLAPAACSPEPEALSAADSGSGGGKADGPGCPEAAGGSYFEFLDDVCQRKVFPSDLDRAWSCPNLATTATPTLANGATVRYRTAGEVVSVDQDALVGIVPDDLRVAVILVRRVDGVPHYRYLSNGTAYQPFQPWSSTKFMAAANAAANLRIRSDYRVGLTGSVGGIPLGDLVTVIHDYDEQRYTSNGLARYFHELGYRWRANDLIHSWLGRPADESFGGNYGMPAPALAHTITEADGASVTIAPDYSSGPRNRLSALTLAEFLKRLVMHREDAATRLPGIQWADVATLLYGAEDSRWYPGQWGGMSADLSIYLQSALSIEAIEERSAGQWRIFSKLGLGDGEFVNVGYACLPALDDSGAPIPDVGKEVFVAARLASSSSWAATDSALAAHYRAILGRVVDGRLK